MAEQLTIAGVGIPLEEAQRVRKGNPLVAVFGPGPEGTTCRSCVHLYHHGGHARSYLKCDLRRFTHGPGTDHRAGWPTCAKYEEGDGDA